MFDKKLYIFNAYYGGYGRNKTEIRVLFNQSSTAWVAALEIANRSGPLSLVSLEVVRNDPVDQNAPISSLNLS